jgi:two-component system, chemotaxis family, protein-glutamate methylesterase/glutaminase
MIRVVVAAGSAAVRGRIAEAVAGDPEISVVPSAASLNDVVEVTKRTNPDIVILGIGPSHEDVFDATKQVMIEAPTPIAIVADAEDAHQVEIAMKALKAGALTVLALPGASPGPTEVARRTFSADVKAMSQVKVVRHWRRPEARPSATTPMRGGKVIAIAASTGGPAALQRILSELPVDFPSPILVVQHISVGFVQGLADWLHSSCALKIKTAVQGDILEPSTVYLAADGHHLGVTEAGAIALSDQGPIGGFKPSANFLFESVAQAFRTRAVGVILTGMGRDGVEGLRTLRRLGGHIVAQDEASSIVFGMPGTAISAGIVNTVSPLSDIPTRLSALVNGG